MPLAFDGRSFHGLQQRILPLDVLRLVRDGVWRELVGRACRDSPARVIAAVGVAMPGLHAAA